MRPFNTMHERKMRRYIGKQRGGARAGSRRRRGEWARCRTAARKARPRCRTPPWRRWWWRRETPGARETAAAGSFRRMTWCLRSRSHEMLRRSLSVVGVCLYHNFSAMRWQNGDRDQIISYKFCFMISDDWNFQRERSPICVIIRGIL